MIEFTKETDLDGENKYYNTSNKILEKASKQFTIYKPPLILIILVKR
jgi:hypothetical protein